MQRYLNIINKLWKDKYVRTDDGAGTNADGIYDHMEWFVPGNIYEDENSTTMLRCFLTPKFEEDKDIYGVNEDGFIVREYNPSTLVISELTENGDIKQS